MQRNLTVAEAQDVILEEISPLGAEMVAVSAAQGRVLAQDVESGRVLPPADCSAMDGYAVNSASIRAASQAAPVELPVVFEVAAGGVANNPLREGEAARIFTGAPIPPGADSVIMQEHVEALGEFVRISGPVNAGDHIRAAGEDLQIGDRVLTAGSEVRAPTIGVLASLGRSVVSVFRRPRIAILSSGDELVEPDGEIEGGRIVSSNSYTLAAQCREIGADPIYLGIARDRPEELEAHVRAGLTADCIVTSAGVSVGDHDHVKAVLQKLGCEIRFWGVQMKPGHPMVFGRFPNGPAPDMGGPFMFGLPGNPVSAAVTFEQFVRPALRAMMGFTNVFRPTLRARLSAPLQKRPGRLTFVRVELERRAGEIWASSTGNQSSGVFRSMAQAQGLLVFPGPASELAEGDEVTVQIIDEGFFSRPDRGFEGA
jgi:molybdopterin molybdotransferase